VGNELRRNRADSRGGRRRQCPEARKVRYRRSDDPGVHGHVEDAGWCLSALLGVEMHRAGSVDVLWHSNGCTEEAGGTAGHRSGGEVHHWPNSDPVGEVLAIAAPDVNVSRFGQAGEGHACAFEDSAGRGDRLSRACLQADPDSATDIVGVIATPGHQDAGRDYGQQTNSAHWKLLEPSHHLNAAPLPFGAWAGYATSYTGSGKGLF